MCAGVFGLAAALSHTVAVMAARRRATARASTRLHTVRTLNRLEVVDNGDAQAGDGVEDGQHHDVQAEGAKQGLRCRRQRTSGRQ